ncbi:hypothetical protein E2C01_037581 [Portunus trituberculatus]|uniref:Uncharacterized protein n=1 Tax=Portunus trituberculatus TaxID=210409 RepID=A0A5B7FFP3_PORTR|nr:hypothetical protein [Portunus trituberculatus]
MECGLYLCQTYKGPRHLELGRYPRHHQTPNRVSFFRQPLGLIQTMQILHRIRELRMCTGIWYTGITSNTISERYSGGCEKGDDRALYTTKHAAV